MPSKVGVRGVILRDAKLTITLRGGSFLLLAVAQGSAGAQRTCLFSQVESSPNGSS